MSPLCFAISLVEDPGILKPPKPLYLVHSSVTLQILNYKSELVRVGAGLGRRGVGGRATCTTGDFALIRVHGVRDKNC